MEKIVSKKGRGAGAVKSASESRMLLQWQAPEFAHHEKTLTWFIVAAAAAAVLIAYGIVSGGWTFSVAIAVFAGTYYLVHRNTPRITTIKITTHGLEIGASRLAFSHMKGFWLVYDPPHVKKLYLRMAGRFHPDIFVSLESVDPAAVRQILKTHLDEISNKAEPFSDTLVRLFKL